MPATFLSILAPLSAMGTFSPDATLDALLLNASIAIDEGFPADAAYAIAQAKEHAEHHQLPYPHTEVRFINEKAAAKLKECLIHAKNKQDRERSSYAYDALAYAQVLGTPTYLLTLLKVLT
jgi:hypothetical protein